MVPECGIETKKARSPWDLVRELGIFNNCGSEELRDHRGKLGQRSSNKYIGSRQLRDLKTNSRTLKSILKESESQCTLAKTV